MGPLADTQRGFQPRIESLRGLAALMVAAFHASQTPLPDGRPLLGATLDGRLERALLSVWQALVNGHGAVVLFFVISGYVLAQSLGRGPQATAPAARRFFVARVFRLYPAVITSVFAFAVVFWIGGHTLPGVSALQYAPTSLIANALLLQATVNGVLWTLQVELLAAPAIFLAFLAARRWGVWPLAALVVVFAAGAFTRHWSQVFGPTGPAMHAFHAFFFGMLASAIGGRLFAGLTPSRAALSLAAAVAGFLVARPVLGWTSNYAVLLEAASGAVMIGVLVFAPELRAARFLDAAPVRFLGRVSFSFYLLHPLTLIVIWQWTAPTHALLGRGVPVLLAAMLLTAVTVAAILPLAALSYRWIERPCIALGRQLAAPGAIRPAQTARSQHW